jgi:SAM-dependent methyltransferase
MTVAKSIRGGPLKALFDGAQRRAPYVYWKARNGMALLGWYHLRLKARLFKETPPDAYDAAFWKTRDCGDQIGFARVVLKYFGPRSVLDVGCGEGDVLEGFVRANARLKTKGFDHSRYALARAAEKGLDVAPLNIAELSKRKIDELTRDVGEFDLAICLEVAEHLPAWHGEKLLRLLTKFDLVIFSAAHPNQGGLLHVNEQPPLYWVRKFKRLGFALAGDNEKFRSEIAELDIPSWYVTNINVFRRRS